MSKIDRIDHIANKVRRDKWLSDLRPADISRIWMPDKTGTVLQAEYN
jgi:hypothetical protein